MIGPVSSVGTSRRIGDDSGQARILIGPGKAVPIGELLLAQGDEFGNLVLQVDPEDGPPVLLEIDQTTALGLAHLILDAVQWPVDEV